MYIYIIYIYIFIYLCVYIKKSFGDVRLKQHQYHININMYIVSVTMIVNSE